MAMSTGCSCGVLGVFGGSARVAFDAVGDVLEVHTGDVVVIPAGVAHRFFA
jgi:uncharacterized protein YjlB